MSKDLVTQRAESQSSMSVFSDQGLQDMLEMARYFLKSGAVPSSLKNEAQVFMVIQAGKEKGMSPVQSINSFYIVNGRISMWGSSVPARLHLYGIRIQWIEKSDKVAHLKLVDTKSGLEHEEKFTIDDARRANLLGKDLYKTYPMNMLAFKAIGNAIRFFCPHVLDGMYIAEEIEAEPEEPKASAQQQPVGKYGVPVPRREQRDAGDANFTETPDASPDPVAAEPEPDTETPEPASPEPVSNPEPQKAASTPQEPKAEPEKFNRIKAIADIRASIAAAGFGKKEDVDAIIVDILKGNKTDEALKVGVWQAGMAAEIVAHMRELGMSEEDFMSHLTEGTVGTVREIFKNSEKIKEWRDALQ